MKTTFFCSSKTGFYFRIFGYGVSAQRDMPRLFSERMGARRVLRLGRWALQLLYRRELGV